MLNRIIHFSLYNRLVVLILSGLILVGGCIALVRSEIDIFPDLNAPTVVVMTEAPGLAPEEVEKLVTFPIETAVNGATGVRRVRSSSATGFSVVWVEFDWDTDVYVARQIVSEKIAPVAESLPPGVKAPALGPQSSILGEIMIIGLTVDAEKAAQLASHGETPTTMSRLRSIADREIRPRLLSIGGVSQVSVIGGDVSEFQILLSPDRMRYLGITLPEVLAATESLNENASGGTLYEFGNEYIIKGSVNTSDTDEYCKNSCKVGCIRHNNTGRYRPGERGCQRAEIRRSICKNRTGSASDRHQTTGCRHHRADGKNRFRTGRITLYPAAGCNRIHRYFPPKRIHRQFCKQPPGIIARRGFDGDNSAVLLPDEPAHHNSLTGGTPYVNHHNGDNTAVDECKHQHYEPWRHSHCHRFVGRRCHCRRGNVYKRLRENRKLPDGERRRIVEVVYEASKEVRTPIFNSSLIIVASFLPLFFLTGMEGRMLIPLGVSFIVALAASTIVALTLTPVLCSYMLGSDKAMGKLDKEPWLTRHIKAGYEKSLQWCMAHGKSVLIATGILFLAAAGLFFTLGRSFLPSFNEGSMTINVSTLPGISLEESDKVGRLAEEVILSIPEVQTVARKTGRAELDEHSLGVNVSEIEAPYKLDSRSRNEMVRELRGKLTEIPGVNIEIGQPISHRMDAMLSGTEAQIAVKLFGPDLNRLFATGQQIKKIMSGIPGITDVNIEQQIERPQINIAPRREMLAKYGITMREFTEFIDVALAGKAVSQVYDSGLPYDITVKFEENARNSKDLISMIMIDSNVGKIPLSYVADVVSTTGPNTINRENVNRRLVISANVDGRDLRGAVNEIRKEIEKDIKLPEGYYLSFGGQFESEAEASSTLALMSLLALLIIFMLLYADFKNISQSLVILINMPLAMIGGVLILVFTGGELNIPAVIGFISLLGIATRNGMLLISRYNQLENEGIGLEQRIAIGSTDRLTPIIMTALTSALALIPLALRSSVPGNEIQSPLAVVILGGLISSTSLNVFVVPVLYRYITNRRDKRRAANASRK